MQPDRREAEPRHHRGKVLGDAARAQRRPVLAGEHAPAVGPRARPRHALGELGLAPGPQRARGALVNLDDPLGVLALGGVELVVDLGLPDVDAAAREVDVAPAQPVIGGHSEQRLHPVVLDAARADGFGDVGDHREPAYPRHLDRPRDVGSADMHLRR